MGKLLLGGVLVFFFIYIYVSLFSITMVIAGIFTLGGNFELDMTLYLLFSLFAAARDYSRE